jgi:hypothetical protein
VQLPSLLRPNKSRLPPALSKSRVTRRRSGETKNAHLRKIALLCAVRRSGQRTYVQRCASCAIKKALQLQRLFVDGLCCYRREEAPSKFSKLRNMLYKLTYKVIVAEM